MASHKCFSEKFWLPYPGFREYNWGNKNKLGAYFEYWAANESSTTDWYRIWAGNSDSINLAWEAKTYGFSVRCFKDTERKPLNFDTKWGNIILTTETVRWWENIAALPIPSRANSTFLWWYTTSWYEEWTKVSVNYIPTESNSVTLYAKWECNEWYQETTDWISCISNTVTITYDATSHSWTINWEATTWGTVAYNATIALPTTGTTNIVSQKDWYQFIWWTDELWWTEPIAGEQTITEDVTYYPIFKKAPVQYRAVFSW
jgi:hypothetical protein